MQRVGAHLDADKAALDEIDGPGHGAEMDALRRGAALDVGMSLSSARLNSRQECGRSERASTQACTTQLSVEPCEVRASSSRCSSDDQGGVEA
jgi:hypothetical protein